MMSVVRNVAKRGVQMQNKAAMSTIVLPDLTFDYGALEPVVSLIENKLTIDSET